MNLGDKTFSFAKRLEKLQNENFRNEKGVRFKNFNNNADNEIDDVVDESNSEPPQFLKKKYIEDYNENNMVMTCKFLIFNLLCVGLVNDLGEEAFDLDEVNIEEQRRALEMYQNSRNIMKEGSDRDASIIKGNRY